MSRSCLSHDTIGCSTSPMQLSSVVKSSNSGRNSVADMTSFYNSSGVDQPQHRGGEKLRLSHMVYVLNMRGKPLMPTCPQRAKQLLKQGRAKVIRRKPFVIQLGFQTGETKYNTRAIHRIQKNRVFISGLKEGINSGRNIPSHGCI